jgi:sugar phosphate permease
MADLEKNLVADSAAVSTDAKTDISSGTIHEANDEDIYIDPAKERKVLHKCDIFMTSLLTLSFLSAYLDRSNIGNAAIAGMPEDLGMDPQQLANAVLMFYVTYVPFELPGALLVKKIRPSRLLPLFM